MIYADYASTTPVDPAVLREMQPFFTDVFYNTSSNHAGGIAAQRAVMKARMDIARCLGTTMGSVLFTSGSTEAISLAVLGHFRNSAQRRPGQPNTFVTCATEHAAMLDTAKQLQKEGYTVRIVDVDADGVVVPESLRNALDETVLMVSVMAVNNETGVIQDIKSIASAAHDVGALFMTDATQAFGKLPLNVTDLGADLLCISAHKIYGPKGTGALICATPESKVLQPLQFGGGQENGVRSGTLNVPGIVGLAAAGTLAYQMLDEESTRIKALRDSFEESMKQLGATVNGEGAERCYHVSNITFKDVTADALLDMLDDVCCSKGSACSSAKTTPSHVLKAMGLSDYSASCSLRFSFGRYSTDSEVQLLIQRLIAVALTSK